MDAETSLSRIVLEAIPHKGATWGDIRREVPDPPPWALDSALASLLASELVRKGHIAETVVFYRTEHAPPAPRDLPFSTPQQRLTRSEATRKSWETRARPLRYDDLGRRYCSKGRHYTPVNRFARGPMNDGLQPWCRDCKKRAREEEKQRIANLEKEGRACGHPI